MNYSHNRKLDLLLHENHFLKNFLNTFLFLDLSLFPFSVCSGGGGGGYKGVWFLCKLLKLWLSLTGNTKKNNSIQTSFLKSKCIPRKHMHDTTYEH